MSTAPSLFWNVTDPSPLDVRAFAAGWREFLHHLDELDVTNAPSVRPLVDGGMLVKSLGVKPGKWLGNALDVCLAWQFQNPGVEDPEEVIKEVDRQRAELEIPSPN